MRRGLPARRLFGLHTRYAAPDDSTRGRRDHPGAFGKTEDEPMGFLDKAKQLAEQAQQKQ